METYRVFAYDINTNSLLCELPANELSFDVRLNDIGAISFTLALSRPQVAAMVAPIMGYQGRPFKVYVDRNGVIVWSGIIWTWNYSRSTGVLSLSGKEMLSYFAHRTIANDYSVLTYPKSSLVAGVNAGDTAMTVESDAGFAIGQLVYIGSTNIETKTIQTVSGNIITLTTGLTYSHAADEPVWFGIDPAQLIYKAFTDAQDETLCGNGASIGMIIQNTTSSIQPITPGYPLSQHTTVLNIARDMASINAPGAGTVDSVGDSQWNPSTGLPVDTMYVYTPRAGRPGATSGLIFDLSNVIDYTFPLDSNSTGTNFTVTGSGTGNATATATVLSAEPVGNLGEMPRLDKVISFSNVQSESQLAVMAYGLAQQYGSPVATPTLTQPTAVEPQLGSWIIGDDARLYLPKDELFTSGLDENWRIVQYAVKVPDEGVSTVTLTFNQPPIF